MRLAGSVGTPYRGLAATLLVLSVALAASAAAQDDVFFRSADARVVTFEADSRFGDLDRTRMELDGPYDGSYQFGFRALSSSGQAPPGQGLRGRARYTVIWTCLRDGGSSSRLGRANARGDARGNAFVTRNLDASGCDDVRVDVVHRGNSTIPAGGSLLEESQAVRIAPAGSGGLTDAQPGDTCVPGPHTLCLREGRFKVEFDWRTTPGENNLAVTLQRSPEDGDFWFFDPDNAGAVVKVLDGCRRNNRFWVFAAALTNVDYTITVTDVPGGEVREYTNPLGRPAPPIQDTNAFATCP